MSITRQQHSQLVVFIRNLVEGWGYLSILPVRAYTVTIFWFVEPGDPDGGYDMVDYCRENHLELQASTRRAADRFIQADEDARVLSCLDYDQSAHLAREAPDGAVIIYALIGIIGVAGFEPHHNRMIARAVLNYICMMIERDREPARRLVVVDMLAPPGKTIPSRP